MPGQAPTLQDPVVDALAELRLADAKPEGRLN